MRQRKAKTPHARVEYKRMYMGPSYPANWRQPASATRSPAVSISRDRTQITKSYISIFLIIPCRSANLVLCALKQDTWVLCDRTKHMIPQTPWHRILADNQAGQRRSSVQLCQSKFRARHSFFKRQPRYSKLPEASVWLQCAHVEPPCVHEVLTAQ